MEEFLSKLNKEQLEAVTSTEGMVRVIAGAGSGKTRALSGRFAFLVNEIGILPGNILCVTFTNKAANEMRQRIHNLTGDNDTGYINTFHGFCVSVLQEDSHVVQYPKSFLVLDNPDIDTMLQGIYEERGLTLRDMTFSNARDMIEMIKLKERPDYYLDMIDMSLEALKAKYEAADTPKEIIFYGYLYQEKKCFGLDYNDLIKYTLYIFSHNDEVRLKWQKRLEYIMIDEFQDIDDLQYELMEVLCAYHKNLFIVGDPDQTIYSWRGANGKYLMDFDKDFEDVKTIMMMQNYRSTPEIIGAVNSMIGRNRHRIKKDLIPTLSGGPAVCCHRADHQEAESKWIAGRIRSLAEQGASLSDIAILYRAHYVTRAVEEELLKEKIPYVIYSGVQFFGRMEIKDALAYLRMIAYKDDLSFLRICNIPKRNLGKRRIAFLKETAESHGLTLYETLKENLDAPQLKGSKARDFIELIESYAAGYEGRQISDLLSSILDDSGYEMMLRTEGSQERLDNLAELKQSVYEYETSCGEETELTHYLAHVALFANTDTAEMKDKVKLMTVHAAKGLEFPHVILCGMNEGVFPSRKITTIYEMEEERRLAFVAMTRAEKSLTLTMADGWNFDGSPRYPSRFVLDIDQSLIEYTSPPQESLIKAAKDHIRLSDDIMKKEEEIEVLEKGRRIEHFIFGKGTVLDADMTKKAHIVQFDDMDTPRTISFRAKLTKI
jgi:DNA helicase-2/ATP-dependent DNA helicase PcrA